MALAVTSSSTSFVFSSSNSRTEQGKFQSIGELSHLILLMLISSDEFQICVFLGLLFSSSNYQPSDRYIPAPAGLNVSRKRSSAVKALNAEPKRNDSIVPSAATVFAPGMFN